MFITGGRDGARGRVVSMKHMSDWPTLYTSMTLRIANQEQSCLTKKTGRAVRRAPRSLKVDLQPNTILKQDERYQLGPTAH